MDIQCLNHRGVQVCHVGNRFAILALGRSPFAYAGILAWLVLFRPATESLYINSPPKGAKNPLRKQGEPNHRPILHHGIARLKVKVKTKTLFFVKLRFSKNLNPIQTQTFQELQSYCFSQSSTGTVFLWEGGGPRLVRVLEYLTARAWGDRAPTWPVVCHFSIVCLLALGGLGEGHSLLANEETQNVCRELLEGC